jgi:WD40-like Beta Propeller Repeat
VDHGTVPALSPDGQRVAFQRAEHDLHVQRIGGQHECVVEGRGNDDTRRSFGWSRKPIWSPDGRLLLFWTTLGKRHAEPRHAEFVTEMRKKKAAAERRRAKGATPRKHVDYDGSIEHAHWEFQHSVGIVDFETREVWMTDAHWSDAAWGPVPVSPGAGGHVTHRSR